MTTERVDGEDDMVLATSAVPSLDVLRRALSPGPARTLLGSVTEMLHVDGPTVIHGHVASGLVVAEWSRVDVHGRVDGPVGLGCGAVLRVRGEFRGDVVGDDGLVIVSGQVSLAAARSGRVVLERGSLVVGSHGEGWWIGPSGALVRTAADRHVEVTLGAREFIVFDPVAERFEPALQPVR